MEDFDPTINTGFIEKAPSLSSWKFGGETGATKPIIEPLGQYDLWLPDEELQYRPGQMDTMACTVFSALNNIETLLQRLRAKGLLPATHEVFLMENGYIDPTTNHVNLSDRFTAKSAGTTHQGTALEPVAESIRKLHGLLPEKDWAFPDLSQTNGFGWDIYYADIPQELQKKAKKFLDYFEISWEWVVMGACGQVDKMKEALKYGPLQIASQTCGMWNSGNTVTGCGCGQATHATMIYGMLDDGTYKDFDHYVQFKKTLAPDYGIPWVMQYSIVAKDPVPVYPVLNYVFKVPLEYGMPASPEVHRLQEALQALKKPNGASYMKKDVFGKFGDITRKALGEFQTSYSISDTPVQGTHLGPRSRAALNMRLLNKT